jgi:hypothetical protein
MNWSGFARGAIAAVTLCCFGLPQAEAIEIVAGPSPVVHMNDGMVSKVVVVRRGGGAYRGGYRGGAVYHGGVYRGPRGGVYRGGTVYRGGAYGGWARPGWYRWGPGGAIAAGAAIGFVGAAAAASWAGAAPGPGLCWYYTDPSRRQGFWDACPY